MLADFRTQLTTCIVGGCISQSRSTIIWLNCKGTTRFPCTTTFSPITSYHFLFISDPFQPCAIFSTGDIPSPIIVEGRIALHGIAQLSHSSLPNMGGLVLYMVTCIYTLCTDQGSLESISKDFPCVRYVVL
jgi:hypothetical protein